MDDEYMLIIKNKFAFTTFILSLIGLSAILYLVFNENDKKPTRLCPSFDAESKVVYLRVAGTSKFLNKGPDNKLTVQSNLATTMPVLIKQQSDLDDETKLTVTMENFRDCSDASFKIICDKKDEKIMNRFFNQQGSYILSEPQLKDEWQLYETSNNNFTISKNNLYWALSSSNTVVLSTESQATEWEVVEIDTKTLKEGTYKISKANSDLYLNMNIHNYAVANDDEPIEWVVKQTDDGLYYFEVDGMIMGYKTDPKLGYVFAFSDQNLYQKATFKAVSGDDDNWYFVFKAPFCPTDSRCQQILDVKEGYLTLTSEIYPQTSWNLD